MDSHINVCLHVPPVTVAVAFAGSVDSTVACTEAAGTADAVVDAVVGTLVASIFVALTAPAGTSSLAGTTADLRPPSTYTRTCPDLCSIIS
jgi:hypothetical protein